MFAEKKYAGNVNAPVVNAVADVAWVQETEDPEYPIVCDAEAGALRHELP